MTSPTPPPPPRWRDRARGWVQRGRELVAWFQEERPDDPVVMRCLRGLLTIDFRDRILIIAGQSFVALVPLLIVVASLVDTDGAADLAERFAYRFGMDQQTAEEIGGLFARPPEAASGISVVGFVIVVFSVTSLGRAIRRTYEVRWGLPRATGVAATRDALAGVFLLALMGAASQLAVQYIPPVLGTPVTVAVQLLMSCGCWLLAMWLFLIGRVELRRLWPGAVYASVAMIVAGWVAEIYLPRLILTDVMRYGAIGFSFALVSWLIVLGAVVASTAVVGAEIAREVDRRHPGEDATDGGHTPA